MTLPSPTITVTVARTPTPIATKENLEVTPTIEPVETPSDNSQPIRICSMPFSRFDIESILGIREFSHLSFLDEETLQFRGWSARPAPAPVVKSTTSATPIIQGTQPPPATPVTQEPQPPLGGFVSARILSEEGQLNLATGDIVSSSLDFMPLLNDPCHGNCPSEIIGESPNQQWQLVQISDAGEAQRGFWLVDENQAVRLVDYVPFSSTWQWAEDSSLLWLVHATEEHGADSLVIQLDDLVVINRSETGSDYPLDATYYYLAFSPQDKLVISTGNPFEQDLSDKDELYIFDLTKSLSQPVEIQTIPGIKNVIWNEATQSFLLSIVQEDETEIRTLDGDTIVRVPGYQMPVLNFALAPSGKHLAIGYGAVDGIRVFTCE